MPKPQVYDAADVQAETRTSPAQRIIDSLEGEYKTMRQTAELCGVHIETLRRLCRTDRVKAPSKATKSGKLVIYLFTDEDIEEVQNYFSDRDKLQSDSGSKVHGNQKTEKVR
jgi:hypothetical protein